METSYDAQFNSRMGSSLNTRTPTNMRLNRGDIRKEVKVPYSPPHRFETIYNDNFADKKGSEEVGALSKEGNTTQPIRKAPKGQYEDMKGDIKVKLASGTSNAMNY